MIDSQVERPVIGPLYSRALSHQFCRSAAVFLWFLAVSQAFRGPSEGDSRRAISAQFVLSPEYWLLCPVYPVAAPVRFY